MAAKVAASAPSAITVAVSSDEETVAGDTDIVSLQWNTGTQAGELRLFWHLTAVLLMSDAILYGQYCQ
jgi:hypothetical protein